MGVPQDATKHAQSSPPPSLRRKYIRTLLEAFEPHQDAVFADLDRQIEESNPDSLSREMDTLFRQWQKKMKQLEQIEKIESETEVATLIALLDEVIALNKTQMMLWEQLR